jgi:hypothetical protein
MTYSTNSPQATDIPADSQSEFLTDFQLLNSIFGVDHIPFGNVITAATRANPCKVTSPNHRLTTGATVTVYRMKGTNSLGQPEAWSINGSTFTVTVVDANNFTLNGLDSSAFDSYIADTGDYLVTSSYPYGFHKKVSFLEPLTNNPGLVSPQCSIYTKMLSEISRVFRPKDQQTGFKSESTPFLNLKFQNGNTQANSTYLTGCDLKFNNLSQVTPFISGTQFGFKTPFGLTFNVGRVFVLSNGTHTVPNVVNYDSVHYTTVFANDAFSTGVTRVTVLNLSNFQFTASGLVSPNSNAFYYLSVGR